MAASMAEQLGQNKHGDGNPDEIALPCILDRLSRLENNGFSYNELLYDFASRRCVGPVKEDLPAKQTFDPAGQTDEIVQAYLSLTRGKFSALSTKWASGRSGKRDPLALCGLTAVNAHGKSPQRRPQTQPPRNVVTSRRQQQVLEVGLRESLRKQTRGPIDGGDETVRKDNFWSTGTRTRRARLRDERKGFTEDEGRGSGGSQTQSVPEASQIRAYSQSHGTLECHVDTLEELALTSSSRKSGSPMRRSSSDSSPGHRMRALPPYAPLDFYPSLPGTTGEAAVTVSLISPRTSKRIRRLPQPAESDLESLQRVEHATRTFSAQELQWNKHGGLYSTIGRSKVGLVDADIDDLMAVSTSRTVETAAAKRAVVATSLKDRSNGVQAKLLRPSKATTLPTVSPACFHDAPGSRPAAPGASKLLTSGHRVTGKPRKGCIASEQGPIVAAVAAAAAAVRLEQGLETSERLKVFGADEIQHKETLGGNLRRLRALLGEAESNAEARSAGSPPLFSVRELRAIGAIKRRRQHADTLVGRSGASASNNVTQTGGTDREGVQREAGLETIVFEGGPTAELAVGGNVLLRNLAKSLFSSMQCRMHREYLLASFQKWKAVSAEIVLQGYVRAIVLIQCRVRRALAIVEASERRRLREHQVHQAKSAVKTAVQRRQLSALRLQKWIRGKSGRRRAKQRRCLLQATRVVQTAFRRRHARARARRWRKEQLRVREAEAREEQRLQDFRAKLRVEITAKVEALSRQEALSQRRSREIQERFHREGAATRIQACWRACVLKRNLSAAVRIGKRAKAIRIQRAFRVVLAKGELQRRREAFQIRSADEVTSSIKIQSLVRRRIAWNRVEEMRFQISKEKLVSTMDAEQALRVQVFQVPKIKAIAARAGKILSAEGKGKPYIIDPVAFKVMLVDKRRAMTPWQESTDRNAATKIQAVFRGHRQVVRVRRMRVRRRREEVENRRRRQFKAANNLQRVFRGRRARVEAKSRRYGLRAVRIQKVWRGFLGRRAAADRRQRIQAATLLQRRLRVAQARTLATHMRQEAVTWSAPAVTIQAAARRFQARRRRNRLVGEKQIEGELSTMAAGMAAFCVERARLRVIMEGAEAPNCRGDGVTQFIFRKIAVKRSGEGSGSFRLEGRAFSKLFVNTPGVFSPAFLATDADLVFARVKHKDEKTLTYAQFASALNFVAATIFPEVKRFRDFRVFKAKAARLLELVETKLLKAPGAVEYRNFSSKAGERFVHRSVRTIQAAARGYLGRKHFECWRRESEEVARIELETSQVVKIQALGRRYCARCRTIRLAQARISKFIDPATHLPYWFNPANGLTTWTKPKIFGGDDVKHAVVVATSKTEYLVKCSVCDVSPVKRMCTSCRDSYCEDCFHALHGKGKRQAHVSSAVNMCGVCNYQHASRVCDTCASKASSTCAFCDVCFFNLHPGLDNLSKAEVTADEEGGGGGGGGAEAWILSAATKQDGWNHSWTNLVVVCVECRRLAARWLCDDCEEVYCAGCYASVHRHGAKMKHGAEKLPYYTADLHIEYGMACRKRTRKERDDEARQRWLEEQARAQDIAALKIQAGWRGRVGRIKGRAYLKVMRAGQRAAWRQRKHDDRKRNALWYKALDLVGLAPQLASDRLDEQVLRRVPRLARARPRKYIALNREDDAWVPGKLEGRKGNIRRGFGVGKIDELKDQAKRGGVRLPGAHSLMSGHRCIYTDPAFNMADFLKPKNVIRVQGELFNVEAIERDHNRIRVDRVWHKQDAKPVLLYKMVLNRRQKLLLKASKEIWSSQAMQYCIQTALVWEEDLVNRLLRKAAIRYKRRRQKRLYALAKKALKNNEDKIRSLKLKLNTAQFGLDNSLASGELHMIKETADPAANIPGSSDSSVAWVEVLDEETGRSSWKNTVTGEVTVEPPRGMKDIEKMVGDLAKQKEKLRAKKAKKR